MKHLDELLLGSLVFFLLDRIVRFVSNYKYGDKKTVSMLATELALLVAIFLLILRFRKVVNAVNI
jgi:hypothetical protein